MKTKLYVVTTPATPEVTEYKEVEIATPRYSKKDNYYFNNLSKK